MYNGVDLQLKEDSLWQCTMSYRTLQDTITWISVLSFILLVKIGQLAQSSSGQIGKQHLCCKSNMTTNLREVHGHDPGQIKVPQDLVSWIFTNIIHWLKSPKTKSFFNITFWNQIYKDIIDVFFLCNLHFSDEQLQTSLKFILSG